MVLSFFQLRNHTSFTFDLRNSENPADNYTVRPYDTTSTQAMWLAQGDGRKGVSVCTYSDGSSVRPFLYMWDEDWKLRYRVGGQAVALFISVNGNKDFYIDVYDDCFLFVCNGGTFKDAIGHQVRVDDWKDLITNHFVDTITNTTVLQYAKQYSYYDQDKRLFPRMAKGERVKKANRAQRQEITNLVAEWEADYLEHGRGQGTIISDGSRNGWRIDLQDNGAVVRNGMHFYNLAVQYNGGRDNVYAHVMLPVGYVIGRRRIRNAFIESMNGGGVAPDPDVDPDVAVIFPPENGQQLLSNIPYTTDNARTSWAVRSLTWMCIIGADKVFR